MCIRDRPSPPSHPVSSRCRHNRHHRHHRTVDVATIAIVIIITADCGTRCSSRRMSKSHANSARCVSSRSMRHLLGSRVARSICLSVCLSVCLQHRVYHATSCPRPNERLLPAFPTHTDCLLIVRAASDIDIGIVLRKACAFVRSTTTSHRHRLLASSTAHACHTDLACSGRKRRHNRFATGACFIGADNPHVAMRCCCFFAPLSIIDNRPPKRHGKRLTMASLTVSP